MYRQIVPAQELLDQLIKGDLEKGKKIITLNTHQTLNQAPGKKWLSTKMYCINNWIATVERASISLAFCVYKSSSRVF